MTLVILGGSADRVEAALQVFAKSGFTRAELDERLEASNLVIGAPDGGADVLRAADARGLKYTLVHHGPPDGQPGGTHERAHHRAESHQLPELARRLLARDRLLVTCLAFAYKNGVPDGAAWLVDVRFLENPYWVPELRDLDGRHPAVREFVLRSPAATRLLDGLQSTFEAVLDDYRLRGRMELTFAFGCTGGQHRSVTMAWKMAERLRRRDDIDVELSFRDLRVESAARQQ